MPLYHTSLRLSWDIPGINRRKWSNSFYPVAANAAAAAAAVAALWIDHLKNAARTHVFAYQVYATDLLAGTTDYSIVNIPPGSQRGTIAPPSSSEPYEITSCVSVTIPVANSRPSRKFWRPGLYEADVVAGQSIATGLLASIETAWNAALVAGVSFLNDEDGQTWGSPATFRYTRRKFGRESAENLPEPPAVG